MFLPFFCRLVGKVAADNGHKWVFGDRLNENDPTFISSWNVSIDPVSKKLKRNFLQPKIFWNSFLKSFCTFFAATKSMGDSIQFRHSSQKIFSVKCTFLFCYIKLSMKFPCSADYCNYICQRRDNSAGLIRHGTSLSVFRTCYVRLRTNCTNFDTSLGFLGCRRS